jgi:protease II
VIIYEEKNPDFKVSVENTLSGEYIMIKIESLFKPSTNEVWLKHAGKDAQFEKFWLVQPMQQGVRYFIKHSGEFLYKLSNEEDNMNFKITKIPVPMKIKLLAEGETPLLEGNKE